MKSIGWNGVRLSIPVGWDTRVAGSRHLVIEEEFQPLLQLRWQQNTNSSSPKEIHRLASAFASRAEAVVTQGELAAKWQQLEAKFQILACAGGQDGKPLAGVLCCPDCQTLFHFQIFAASKTSAHSIGECLTSLSCHGHDEDLWQIQDFSLSTPLTLSLSDFTFAAGLTRLSFRAPHLTLQTCRIAPADVRLRHQSLAEILRTLAAIPDLQMKEQKQASLCCEGFRSPGIFQRIRLRMQRRDPFVQAKIHHDNKHNRLLAVVLTSSRPLPAEMLPAVAENYAIV